MKGISRGKMWSERKESTPRLNNDIMSNIFSRIPADLLEKNFKYQCKQWLNVISHPFFIDAHLRRSKDGLLQVIRHNGCHELRLMTINGFVGDKIQEFAVFPKTTFAKYHSDKVIYFRSCDGLLLCKDPSSGIFRLINPVTKEIISLHLSKDECKFSRFYDLVFIPSSVQYRVVELFCENNSWRFHVQTVGVCSSDSLKIIEEEEFGILISNNIYNRVSVNGVLYIHGYPRSPIACFDVGDGTTLRWLRSSPTISTTKFYSSIKLVEIHGFLSLIATQRNCDDFCEIWVLKDVSSENWEKQFSFSACPENLLESIPVSDLRPWTSFNNGELIAFRDRSPSRDSQKVFVYHVKSKQWKLLEEFPKRYKHSSDFVFNHVNSFISPKALK